MQKPPKSSPATLAHQPSDSSLLFLLRNTTSKVHLSCTSTQTMCKLEYCVSCYNVIYVCNLEHDSRLKFRSQALSRKAEKKVLKEVRGRERVAFYTPPCERHIVTGRIPFRMPARPCWRNQGLPKPTEKHAHERIGKDRRWTRA